MPNFLPTNYKQNLLLSINFEDQIQPGTFEYAIHYLIEHKLDLRDFEQEYKNEFGGRVAYPPSVLLKIVLFAYSKGIMSLRRMAELWNAGQTTVLMAWTGSRSEARPRWKANGN